LCSAVYADTWPLASTAATWYIQETDRSTVVSVKDVAVVVRMTSLPYGLSRTTRYFTAPGTGSQPRSIPLSVPVAAKPAGVARAMLVTPLSALPGEELPALSKARTS
jgi:hypothetical protein